VRIAHQFLLLLKVFFTFPHLIRRGEKHLAMQ
jgi:hypothetical protein